MFLDSDWVDSFEGNAFPAGQLAAAMRGVKVGVAWDRHIYAKSALGTVCLLNQYNIPGTVRHQPRDCMDNDILGGLGANLTLNVRMLDQTILLLCGPWTWDFDGFSGCATASNPFGWGFSTWQGSWTERLYFLPLPQGSVLNTLRCLQGAPGMDQVPQLGEIPSSFRLIPQGEQFVREILESWATGFFSIIQDSGVSGFERLGTKVDAELQGHWDEIVAILERMPRN